METAENQRQASACGKVDAYEMRGYQFVFSEVKEPFNVNFDSYLLTKEGVVIYNLMTEPMREDIMRMYKRIFSEGCRGKASMEVRKL